MASELSKFIDDELQKVDTAEERERLISKLRVRTNAKDSGSTLRAAPSWQEQLLPRKPLLIIGLCVFFVLAIATVAISRSSGSSKGKDLEMDRTSEFAYNQDDTQDVIDKTYPVPGEPSSETMHHQGEIPPPGREQGVESNAPGSPAQNIRDDEGSSVSHDEIGKDALDDLPPLPPQHKHSSPASSPRKMGPNAPDTTPASTSTKGHHPAPEEEGYSQGEDESSDDMTDDPSRPFGLAPSPELAEQQERDRATQKYEEEVERRDAAAEMREGAMDESSDDLEDMAPTRDLAVGHHAAGSEAEEERSVQHGSHAAGSEAEEERAVQHELDTAGGSHSHAAHPEDAAEAMAEAEEAAEAEEDAMMAERHELAREEAEAEGLDSRMPPAGDEFEG